MKEKFQELRSINSVLVNDVDRATVVVLSFFDDLVFFESTRAFPDAIFLEFLNCFDGCAEPLEW